MANPPLPPGFELESPQQMTAPVEQPTGANPAPPPGFAIEEPNHPYQKMDEDTFRTELGNRVYRGDSLPEIQKWMTDSGYDPNAYRGLAEAVAYKQKGGAGRSEVYKQTPAQQAKVSAPESDAGHGAFGAGVNGALHMIPYADEIGGTLDAFIPTGQGNSAWETGESFGDQIDRNISENRANAEYDWNHHPYAYGAGATAGVVGSAVAGGAAIRALAALPGAAGSVAGAVGADTVLANTGRAAATGALYGSDVDNGSMTDRLTGAASGAALGAIGDRVLRGAARVAQPVVSQSIRALQDAGVRLSPGQLMGRGGRAIENFASGSPILGNAIKDTQRQAFNDFDQAVVNRAISPTGHALVDEVRQVRPGAVVNANTRVPLDARHQNAFFGTVARNEDPVVKAENYLAERQASLRPNTSGTTDPSDSFTQSLTAAHADMSSASSMPADQMTADIIDRQILGPIQANGGRITEQLANEISNNLNASLNSIGMETSLTAGQKRIVQGYLGELQDHLAVVARDAKSHETATSQVGQFDSLYDSARGGLDTIRNARGMNNGRARPLDVIRASTDDELADPFSAGNFAMDARNVLGDYYPEANKSIIEQFTSPGGATTAAGAIMGHTFSGGASTGIGLGALGLYTNPGRRAFEAIATGDRGRVGTGVAGLARFGSKVAPIVGSRLNTDD